MAGDSTLDGHLGEGTEISGTLRFEGAVRIDGRFKGDIVSPATLILGPSAQVEADLDVGELVVRGHLKGTVKARERVTIHATGIVDATLHTARLAIETGGTYRGRCDMPERRPAGARPKASSATAQAPAPAAEARL